MHFQAGSPICKCNADNLSPVLATHTYVDEQVLIHSIVNLDHAAISPCRAHRIISPVEADKMGASVPTEIWSRTTFRDLQSTRIVELSREAANWQVVSDACRASAFCKCK